MKRQSPESGRESTYDATLANGGSLRSAGDQIVIVAMTPAVAALARMARAIRNASQPLATCRLEAPQPPRDTACEKVALACNPRHRRGSSRASAEGRTSGCS